LLLLLLLLLVLSLPPPLLLLLWEPVEERATSWSAAAAAAASVEMTSGCPAATAVGVDWRHWGPPAGAFDLFEVSMDVVDCCCCSGVRLAVEVSLWHSLSTALGGAWFGSLVLAPANDTPTETASN
jgi:hypothetical protein